MERDAFCFVLHRLSCLMHEAHFVDATGIINYQLRYFQWKHCTGHDYAIPWQSLE